MLNWLMIIAGALKSVLRSQWKLAFETINFHTKLFQ